MRTYSLVAFTSGLILSSAALAIPTTDTFTFSTNLPNYIGAPGQTVDVKVYLNESTPSGTFLLDAENGLASAGVQGTQIPNAAVSPATFAQFTPDVAFNDPILTPLVTVSPTHFSSLAFADILGPAGAPALSVDATTKRVFLGDLLITLGNKAGDVTTFSLADFSPGSDTLSFLHNIVLDPQTPTTFTTTVVVPEPATLAILSLTTVPLFLRRRLQKLK
jgi:hypothetical protein